MGMDHKKLLEKAAVLKNIPRTGWLQRGVPPSDAETIAEHTFEVTSILTIIGIAVQGLNKDRLLFMGAVHDWGESVSGDMPRSLTSRIGKDMKSRTEIEIIKEMAEESGLEELEGIFREYEERKTDEAKLVKFADLLSTLRQAKAYAERGFRTEDIVASCEQELEGVMAQLDSKLRRQIRALLYDGN